MLLTRTIFHRQMTPSCSAGTCAGRGWYPTEDGERYCDCPAGELRMRVDRGEDVQAEWPDEIA